jgi:hypothetical protein
MSAACSYDAAKRILTVTVDGELTLGEFARVLDELRTSSDYPFNPDRIWDLRKGSLSAADESVFREMIALRKRYPEFVGHSVAVVTSTTVDYGLARMYEILSDELDLPGRRRTLRIFSDYDEAQAWILRGRAR